MSCTILNPIEPAGKPLEDVVAYTENLIREVTG
jgi:hypothetical protein